MAILLPRFPPRMPPPPPPPPPPPTPTADDIDLQLRQRARLNGLSRVLRGLGLMKLEDTPDVGLTNFKVKMAESPQDILGGLRRIGRTPDSETFLKELKPDIDEDGLTSIFGKLRPVQPPPISLVSERVTAPQPLPRPPVGEFKPLTPVVGIEPVPPPQPPPEPPPTPGPTPPKEVPTFSQWSATKGFNMEEYATMLRGRGVVEADIPEMLLKTQQDLRDVYEFEFGLGRWGTAMGELEKIAVAEPQRIPEVGKVFGQALARVPKQLRAAIAQARRGMAGAGVVDRDLANRLAQEAQADIDKFAQEISEQYPESKLMGNIAQLPQNIAFSLTSMGAGVAAGVPIAIGGTAAATALAVPTGGASLAAIPVVRAAAWGAGSAVSGLVAYNMTSYQIMQQYLEAKNEEMLATRGSGITASEEARLKEDFDEKARAYGLWEAVPEAISNLAFARILTAPLTRIAGRSITARIVEGLTTMYGQELLTETITQKGQSAIEVEAGLREGRINWTEAFKEIAPQTFLLTTILGGVGSVGVASVNKVKQSLKTEIGTEHPLYQALLNGVNERLTEVLQEGAMAMGGVTPTPESVAFKIAQGRALTRAEEQLRVNNPQAVETALNQLRGTSAPPVTPTPEVKALTAEEVIPGVTEPQQMTQSEFRKVYPGAGADAVHRSAVFGAVNQGKPVPAEVLKSYPDLAKRAEELKPAIPKAEVTPAPGKEKEVWQMTRAEYIAEGRGNPEIHKLIVKERLAQQTPRTRNIVPPEVLKDYPDLAEQAKTLAIPKAEPVPEAIKYPATMAGAEARSQAEGIPISEASRLNAEEALAIQPTETAVGGLEPPSQPPAAVPIEAGVGGGLRPPLTTLLPEPVVAEPTPAVTAEVQAGKVPPAKTPPPAEPPVIEPPEPMPPSGRPRTLTDLNREARGMRALTPEERAGVMDMAKPIAEDELLYKVKPFNEHGDNLLQPDKPINKVLRSIPGIKQATEILYPAQMERDNPVALIGIKKRIFEEVETGRARLASLKWWYQAKQAFDFKKVKGKWRATNITLSPKAEPDKAYHGTIHDLIEHPENYVFNEQQQRVLAAAQDMQNQLLRDAQRVGVDAVELSGDYWRRIVTKAPKDTLFDGKIKSGITSKKGYTRQRAFDFVDDGAKLGFEYETHPLRSLQNRLEAGIRTISDQSARKEIAKLPGIVKPLERLESRYPQTIEGVKAARQARDTAKQTFLRAKTTENEMLLRQAEADYITAMRELYFKKMAAGQPNIGELKLPNGRIAPVELAEDISKWIELPEIRTARGAVTNPILAVTQLLRSTLTNVDLAAGFIQGQALFYRNNLAWWIAQGNAIQSLLDDRMAYVEKNFEVMDEGMRMGAISVPTEFMFTSQGLASIPTRVPVVGPVMKSFNRAFEWFIVVGQTEMFKAARSGAIRRSTGANVKQGEELERQAIEALTSLGSAIRKEMGTESYAILGVRPTQHTIEQVVLFAARFFRAMTGIQAQAFTGGEGGREARRAMGSLIAGGLALLIGIVWVREKKLPNMTDPFASDWMQFKIGNTYFTTFGPFYPYFRAQARASFYLAHGEPAEAAKVTARFLESKEGIPFRGIDMAAQFSMYGSYRTFEGKRLPATPLGIGEAVLGEMAVPISIQEAMTALPEGRYESVIGEIMGLVGRDVRDEPVSGALSKLGQIDQEALDEALKDITNLRKIAEIKGKDWTFDIQSVRKVISSRTKNLSESRISQLNPIVRDYWQFAEQKDEYELLSTGKKKKYEKDTPDFVVNRIFWGELTEIPDLKTAGAVEARAQIHNIPLNMLPAFQLTDKGKERIPSNRELWKAYFDYYALPGGSYLAMSQKQVNAGELPEKYRKDWETYHKFKTDSAKTAFKKARAHREITRGDWRDEFRWENAGFDEWLQEHKGLKPLPKKTTTRARANIRAQTARLLFGGFRPVGRRRGAKLPKFRRVAVSRGLSISAPAAPRV